MKRVYNPFRLMHEPPAITAIIMAIYLCFAMAGLATLLIPSDIALHLFGEPMLKIVGLMTILGGLCGAAAVWPGIWWLERTGLAGCAIGISTYIISLAATGGWDGGVLFREFMIIIIILFLIIRLMWISSLDLDPTKPRYEG